MFCTEACGSALQGNIVAASPAFAHRLPAVFSAPDAFQPDRFAPPREEDKAKPFSYIGFGGGRHGCLGQNFAYLQIKVCSFLSRSLPLVSEHCLQGVMTDVTLSSAT